MKTKRDPFEGYFATIANLEVRLEIITCEFTGIGNRVKREKGDEYIRLLPQRVSK